MPEPDRPRPRQLRVDQMIRSHAIRAAATFLGPDETATDDDLFKLAGRISHYIEGRRRDE